MHHTTLQDYAGTRSTPASGRVSLGSKTGAVSEEDHLASQPSGFTDEYNNNRVTSNTFTQNRTPLSSIITENLIYTSLYC